MDLGKSYYKIKEVAEMLEVSQSTLRYWEQEFPEVSPIRTSSGRRAYTPDNIEKLEIIKFLLKDKGMKIDAVKEQLRHNVKNISTRMKMIDILKSVREELKELLNALDKRR